jgi:threonine/homoserine/homoserine lactone efflux protein
MIQLFWLGFALAASPGPDFFLILRHTLSCGRFIGYATLLGNRISLCLHISLAILGLSVVIQRFPALYLVVRFIGAAYLIYLGSRNLFSRLRHASGNTVTSESESITAGVAIRSGFLNNFLNPKVSLFFLSFFPQFATHEMLTDSPWTVAAVFFLGNTSWWIPLILIVGVPKLRALLFRFQFTLDIIFGLVFIWFGVRIFWQEFF